MKFEKGNKKEPTGNLIVYCNVIGQDDVEIEDKIIVVNIVVSMLKLQGGNPVVSFPPVPLKDETELVGIISRHIDKYDIIKLPDFELPNSGKKIRNYFKKRMKELNQIALEYVSFCNNFEEKKKEETIAESLNFQMNDYISNLANLSLGFRKFKGLTKQVTLMQVENLIEKFSQKYPQFDLDNFQKALSKPGTKGEQLITLYLQKFKAISNKNYEQASYLNKQIINIEN